MFSTTEDFPLEYKELYPRGMDQENISLNEEQATKIKEDSIINPAIIRVDFSDKTASLVHTLLSSAT